MIAHILNVFRKERTDTFRDRRTVFAALAYAFFGPTLILVMLHVIAGQRGDEAPTKLAIEGAEYGPELVAFLEGQNVEVELLGGQETWRGGLAPNQVLLALDAAYAESLQAGRPAQVNLYVDRTDNEASARAEDVRRMIFSFGDRLNHARLLAQGVPPALGISHAIEVKDISAAGARAKQFSFLLIYFFVLAPFFSSLSVSIDTTAGERERRSLQSLLAQPVSPASLVVGKWMIGALFGIVGTTVTVLGGIYAIGLTPLEVLGLRFHLGFEAQFWMLAALIPLALFVSALQIMVALAAKTYKEGNAYMQLLSFAPVVIGLALNLSGKTVEGMASWLPVIAQLQAAQNVLINGTFEPVTVLASSALAVGLAVLCLTFAAQRLGSEKILSAA